MPNNYLKNFITQPIPQNEPLPGQVENSAGGYAWAVDDWTRLSRFLILGSEGGSYYASERKLTKQNAESVMRCIKADGVRVVNITREVSTSGRAPKNDQALFALAMCMAYGDALTKDRAFNALQSVARTGTHLFQFVDFVTSMRGWGRGLRRAVNNWYMNREPQSLAYQGIKYRSRNDYTHRDLMRLAHVSPAKGGRGNPETRTAVVDYLVHGWPDVGQDPPDDLALQTIWAFETAQRMKPDSKGDKRRLLSLVQDFNLPREALPTEWLNDKDVWAALLEKMPITALVRNLGKMTNIGLIAPLSSASALVQQKLGQAEVVKASRIHPLQVLVAFNMYKLGHGLKGKLTWSPVTPVLDALDGAFYEAFGNVTPTNLRWCLALDVSSSMTSPDIANMPGVSPRVGSGLMAMVTARVEAHYHVVAFTAGNRFNWRNNTALSDLDISPKMRLDQVVKAVTGLPFGGTDCSLPIMHALQNKIPVDVFAVFTDSETWAGTIHPSEALKKYRQEMGILAKLIVVGMVSNGFSIADPTDAGMLDVVGFDTAAPNVMADFATGGAVSAQIEETEEGGE